MSVRGDRAVDELATEPRLRQPGKVHEARIAARAGLAAFRRRRSSPRAPDRGDLERLAAALPAEAVVETRLVDVPVDRPPWHGAGLRLDAGDLVSTFAVGRVVLSRALDLGFGADFQLWMRVGGAAPVFRGTRASHTFTAERAGDLEVASYFPGEWADRAGRLATDPADYAKAKGSISALVVRWGRGVDPARVLRGVDDASELVAGELSRLAGTPAPPPGWRHLWFLGESEIYDGAHADGIGCHTHGDVGILQHDVDVPLTEATRLRWRWKVDELPSALPEDTLPTHDYLSVALEFDDGQDLTWHWSCSLPVGHAYRCPIPTWTARETHVVVRSGDADLGRWLTEERPVRRDYAAAIGPPPARIVRVWLIAVSLFQHGTGRCAFADIEVGEGDDVVTVPT